MLFVRYRWARPFVILSMILCLVLVSVFFTSKITNFVMLPLIALLFYNLIIETWVSLAFISPGNRKKELVSDGWISQFHELDTTIHSMSYIDDKIRPLVIIVHGWRSGASSMLGRAENYIKLGFHVILFELPGHGKSEPVSKWTAGHASTTFNDFYDNLEVDFNMKLVNDIYFHGHSMGGFVLLRFDKLVSNDDSRIKGYILESPMTCYSMIFQESLDTLKIPKIAEKPFWSRLSAHFNEINPKISDVTELSDVDTPKWGIIRNNCLIIQAEHDNRLGLGHYNQLVKSQQEITGYIFQHHLVADLSHAGARINLNRDGLIAKWIHEVSAHSDSVTSA